MSFVKIYNLIYRIVTRLANISRKIAKFWLRTARFIARKTGYCEDLFGNILYPPREVRRYISAVLTREDFFEKLNDRRVNYVILRWFETLPKWPQGEDIDLLVADADLDRIADLFSGVPNERPCDVYSLSGQRGGWNSLPYYPLKLGEKLLHRRVKWQEKYFVPHPEDLFYSLMYHVVFHKAEFSGVPYDHKQLAEGQVDHQYLDILEEKGNQIGVACPTHFCGMYELLKQKGWFPAFSTLRKYAMLREWHRQKLGKPTYQAGQGQVQLFVIREWAVEHRKIDYIMEWFRSKSDLIKILKLIHLNENQKKAFAREVRGGVWGKGPYPVSGGLPAVIIVGYDLEPTPVSQEVLDEFPYVTSGNYILKHELRDLIKQQLVIPARVNCIHTSDDEMEAWEDLKALEDPELLAEIKQEVATFRGEHSG